VKARKSNQKAKLLVKRFNVTVSVLFIIGFATVGVFLLMRSRAAVFSSSLEPDSGARDGAAIVVSDPSASGGAYVRFGNAIEAASFGIAQIIGLSENGQSRIFFDPAENGNVQKYELVRNSTVVAELSSSAAIEQSRVGKKVGVSPGLEILNPDKNNGAIENEVTATFDIIKDTGFSYTRLAFLWPAIERDGDNQFRWTAIDRAVDLAIQQNLEIIAEIAYSPSWIDIDGCDLGHCPPQQISKYAEFAQELVKRYGPTSTLSKYRAKPIKVWEVWNEPNLPAFWEERQLTWTNSNGVNVTQRCPSAKTYTALLKAAYRAIHEVDNTATVMVGGLGNSGGCDVAARTFLEMIYLYGGKDSFDALAIHGYSSFRDPLFTDVWNLYPQVGEMQRIMQKYGDAKKAVWQTEASYATSCADGNKPIDPRFPSGDRVVCHNTDGTCKTASEATVNPCFDELAQSAMLVKAIYHWFRWENVGPYNIYKLRDDHGDDNLHDRNNLHENFGLTKYPYRAITNDFQQKLAIPILKRVLNQHVISDPTPVVTQSVSYSIRVTYSDGRREETDQLTFTPTAFRSYLNLPFSREYPCITATSVPLFDAETCTTMPPE
jgi:Cellulase (glycosyl hydrolase family 5)